MAESAPAAPAAAPAAPAAPAAAPAQPATHTTVQPPAQTMRRRVSDMAMDIERKQAEVNTRGRQQVAEERLRAHGEPVPAEPPKPRLLGDDEPAAAPAPAAEPQEGEAEQAIDEQLEQQPQQQAANDQELAAKMREWMDSEVLPDELMNKVLEHTDKHGTTRYLTVKELHQGYMRQSDYQREMNTTREIVAQAQWRDNNVRQHFERIGQDPEYFLQNYEDRGYGAVLEQVATRIAQRKVEDQRIATAAAWDLMQRRNLDQNHVDVVKVYNDTINRLKQARAVESQNRQLQAERDMHAQMRQQTEQQQQRGQRERQLADSMAQLMPMALRVTGIKDNPANRDDLLRHLNGLVKTIDGWDGVVRPIHVKQAAELLREELEDREARRTAKPAPKPKAKPLVSKATSSGSAQPLAQTQTRKRLSEMWTDPNMGFSQRG